MESSADISRWELMENPPIAKRVEALRRLISFFELMGTYAGVKLLTPGRLGSADLLRSEIPVAAENQGKYFTLKSNVFVIIMY